MKSVPLAATAAFALALGAVNAQADDAADLAAAQQAATYLDEMTGGSNLISDAVDEAAANAALEALVSAVEDAQE